MNDEERATHIKSVIETKLAELSEYCDSVLSVKSSKTTRIQEIHAIAGHIMCECVEETLFNS